MERDEARKKMKEDIMNKKKGVKNNDIKVELVGIPSSLL
jgi:hypothetical protein